MNKLDDRSYQHSDYILSQKNHSYGSNIHILDQPYLTFVLARFCSPFCKQPEVGRLATLLSQALLVEAANSLFPRKLQPVKTRMAAEHPHEASFEAELIDPETKVIVVDMIRAGMLPSQACYEILHNIITAESLRMDHIFLNRKTDHHSKVVGVDLSGYKIGGPVQDAYMLIPDPMGATGSSVFHIIELYQKLFPNFLQEIKKIVTLHFIVTPEYLKKLAASNLPLEIFALRLDRGLSSVEALKNVPGKLWDQEKGLNEKDYILPGAGGIGEVLNNSYV